MRRFPHALDSHWNHVVCKRHVQQKNRPTELGIRKLKVESCDAADDDADAEVGRSRCGDSRTCNLGLEKLV